MLEVAYTSLLISSIVAVGCISFFVAAKLYKGQV